MRNEWHPQQISQLQKLHCILTLFITVIIDELRCPNYYIWKCTHFLTMHARHYILFVVTLCSIIYHNFSPFYIFMFGYQSTHQSYVSSFVLDFIHSFNHSFAHSFIHSISYQFAKLLSSTNDLSNINGCFCIYEYIKAATSDKYLAL